MKLEYAIILIWFATFLCPFVACCVGTVVSCRGVKKKYQWKRSERYYSLFIREQCAELAKELGA
jgi:hypothetical protein